VVLLFEWKPGQRWFARYGIGAGAWLVCVVLAMGLNGALTDKQLHYWHSSSALADIAGVLSKIDRDIPDSELGPLLAPTEIKVGSNFHLRVRAAYRPADFQQLLTGDGNLWDVPATEPMPIARRNAIEKAWATIVFGHFGAYLRYRFETFGETLGLHKKFLGATVIQRKNQYAGMLDHMGVGRHESRFQQIGEGVSVWTAKKTRLFRPHLYFALVLILLVFCRQRDVLAIALSGLAMELSLIPLGWTADFRFSHWLVICTVLTLAILIARRARPAT
jgi:hypothetical protein